MGASSFSWLRVVRWCIGLVLLAGCTDAYLPDEIKAVPNYLVVDGVINPVGVTKIKLTRTYAIGSSAAAPPAETRATVYMEEEAGQRFTLRENAGGVYTSSSLTLNPARRYRLRLTTQAGKEYASDFVPVKTTPPIDAVTWRATTDGLNVSVSTHDTTNATQYYRWETDETWEILPPYRPTVEYVNRVMRDIVLPFPTVCYGNAHSTTVQLAKTTAQTQDVVSDLRVRQLSTSSERLYSRYSILVQQFALTKEEYAYWELLRKNTESIGSLFDPQPAQLTGNVRCLSDPNDLALGFVGAHSRTEKRIFVRRADLPRAWFPSDGYEGCIPPDTVFFYRDSRPPPPAVTLENNFNPSRDQLPIGAIYEGSRLAGYTAKKKDCVDCRTRGASVKPTFWP